MEYLKLVLLDVMCLILPLSLYLIYVAYIKTKEKEEDKSYFSFAIIISLLLLITYDDLNVFSTNMFFGIPLLISYLSKRDKLSIMISVILIFFFNNIYGVSYIILSVFYISYYLLYRILKSKKNYYNLYIIFFLLIKSVYTITLLLLSISTENETLNIIHILIISCSLQAIVSFITALFFEKSKKVIDINMTLKELDKEKKLRASVFKLNHELKNPLAVCNGYLEMFEIATEQERHKYLGIIKDEIKRSLTIINDFSSLGKIKELDKEELDLCLLLEDVKEILSPLYKNVDGVINIPDDEIYLNGDYNRLKQVFINILKNSYESKSKRDLIVDIKIKEEQNLNKIYIQDNGKGMSQETLKNIYNEFFTTKEYGTGIGIPYIKQIVELHGGTIEYKSKENKGTTVIIVLPK